MELTQERVIPKKMNPNNGMLLEHIERYRFSKAFAKGEVLDIACGAGYGAEILLENNDQMVSYTGADIDEECIRYAREQYGSAQTRFLQCNALDQDLPRKLGKYDTIVSFETIEHFHGDQQFIENLYQMLKPGGILLISTPFGRGVGKPCKNPYHVHQYTEEEFVDRLGKFSDVTMYHQVGQDIERPKADKKYYLMVALCKKKA
ncbi:MAG TPA: SAM-dependent methyltransferase [Eubacteriaceae bacterium]|nr:SAM-dependent methyltransferase [Eubacteriaceae bacterium]